MEFGDRDLSSAIVLLTRGIDAADTSAAVTWLGTRRGQDGVALADAFDDLTTAYRVAAGEDPQQDEYRELALAWAEGALGGLQHRGALDPTTGLATRDYLATRLRDLARIGLVAEHRLLVVGAGPERRRLPVMLRAARLAVELVGSFAAIETPAQLPGDRIAAIVRVDDGLEAGIAGLRRAIQRIDEAAAKRDGSPATATLHALELPGAPDEVSAFLDVL